MRKIISSETCTPCGECCRSFPYIQITQDDIIRIKEETGLKQEYFAEIKDAEADEYFLRFKDNGDCVFFNEDNGSFSCRVYKVRPQVCVTYPITDVQFEVCEKKRITVLNSKT